MRYEHEEPLEIISDGATDYQIGSSVIAVLVIIIITTLFVLPEATVPLIILAIVVLAPFLFGRTRKTADLEDKFYERKEKKTLFHLTDL